MARALLKINNLGGEVLAPFGVKTNLLEGKLGVVIITLTESEVATTAAVKIKAAANNSMDPQGETATLLFGLSVKFRRAFWRFRPTSSQPFGIFALH